jgi:ribosomal protein L2
VLGFGARALAQQNPNPAMGGSDTSRDQVTATGKTSSELQHSSATVTAIDKSARIVTLKGDDGEKFSVTVPSDLKNFDKLKVGDKVDVDYYQSLAVEMLPPGAKPSMSQRSMKSREMGGGMMGKETTVSAEVVSVDPAANKVTFKGPRGQTKTISVQDPDMQKRLPSLKPGQVVQFTYTEATAASIQPAAK